MLREEEMELIQEAPFLVNTDDRDKFEELQEELKKEAQEWSLKDKAVFAIKRNWKYILMGVGIGGGITMLVMIPIISGKNKDIKHLEYVIAGYKGWNTRRLKVFGSVSGLAS